MKVKSRPALRTAIVLGITSILILGVVWYVNAPKINPKTGQTEIATVDLPEGQAAPEIGQLAPDFTTTAITGETITLSSLVGQPVLLVFVASWCSYCLAEAPDLNAISNDFAGRAHVISIFIGDNQATVEEYAVKNGLSDLLVPDPAKQLGKAYGATGIPAHYFIDAQGIIQGISFGSTPATSIIATLESLG